MMFGSHLDEEHEVLLALLAYSNILSEIHDKNIKENNMK